MDFPYFTRHFIGLLVSACVLALVVLWAYHDAPSNSFLFDDRRNIVEHEPVKMQQFSAAALWRASSEALLPTRPLPSVTFAIDFWRGNGEPRAFIVTNLFLHLGNGLLICLLIAMLLAGQGTAPTVRAWTAATLAAAAWIAHPIQVQAVSYIVQRMAEMAALFTLLGVICYIRARWSMNPHVRCGWYTACVLSLLCGAVSKENAWIAPLLILLTELGVVRREGSLLRTRGERLAGFVALACICALAVTLVAGVGPLATVFSEGYVHRDFTMTERLLTQPRVIFFHLGQILLPLPDRFSLLHDFDKSTSLMTPASTFWAWVAMLMVVSFTVGCLRKPQYRMAGFFMLWLPITLVIESSIVPLEMIFEHRMYLPSVGLAGLLALGLHQMLCRGKKVVVATCFGMVGAVGLVAFSTAERVPHWRTEWQLYQHATRVDPDYPRAFNLYGNALIDVNNFSAAESAFRRVLELAPDYPRVHKYLGRTLAEQGQLVEAELHFRKALERKPDDPDILSNLGRLLWQRGDNDGARRFYERALTIDQNHQAARNNLRILGQR